LTRKLKSQRAKAIRGPSLDKQHKKNKKLNIFHKNSKLTVHYGSNIAIRTQIASPS